jgi:murein DD-endopeptidase MepM/ murein hydrolase activator NlpD
MRLSFRPRIPGPAPSRAHWLQLAACAVLAWAWWRATPAIYVPPVLPPPAQTSAAETLAAPAPAQPPAAPPVQSASLGATTIEVIVQANDTLDSIFRRLKFGLADLASLRALPGLKRMLDALKPGEALHLTERDGDLVGFERRLSPSETLNVTRDGQGFSADVLKNPLETHVRTASGTIDRSLFEAVAAAGARDQTALALAQIFGWDIDFALDIRPGDSFAVTYEELFEDGKFVKDGAVLAAMFRNNGRVYRAARYVDPTGAANYYTPEGRSLRRAFLRTPVDFTRVSSTFDLHRMHPILNLIRAHTGVDYAAPIGTPVHAAGSGHVRFMGDKGGYGNVVEIDHSQGIVTVYGHLSRFAQGIHVGSRVNQGELIAYVGMTGLATGPHLHYEYRVNGEFKNPQSVHLPDALPIEGEWLADFKEKSAPLFASLDGATVITLVAR